MTYDDLSREQLIEVAVQLEEELERTETERDRFEHIAKKAQADFKNYKKDQSARRKKWQHEARRELANELISVMDNMERAIMAAEDADSNLLMGVEMVADELFNVFAERGLERIEDAETFDPRIHNAVETKEHDEDNAVLEVRRKGYVYRDTVLRPADVVVGKKDVENKDTADEQTTTGE